MTKRQEFDRRAGAIEELVRTLESAGDAGLRATARELVQALMELHRAGLDQMMDLTVQAGEPGAALIERFGEDEIVRHILLLHGLHPLDLEARVQQAVEKARRSMRSSGGDVERVVVDDLGAVTVTLRTDAAAHGCASSPAALKTTVQEAIYETAPDVASLTIDISNPEPAVAAFVPIESLRRRDPDRSVAATPGVNGSVAHP